MTLPSFSQSTDGNATLFPEGNPGSWPIGASGLTGGADLQGQQEGRSGKGLKGGSGTRKLGLPWLSPPIPHPRMELSQ